MKAMGLLQILGKKRTRPVPGVKSKIRSPFFTGKQKGFYNLWRTQVLRRTQNQPGRIAATKQTRKTEPQPLTINAAVVLIQNLLNQLMPGGKVQGKQVFAKGQTVAVQLTQNAAIPQVMEKQKVAPESKVFKLDPKEGWIPVKETAGKEVAQSPLKIEVLPAEKTSRVKVTLPEGALNKPPVQATGEHLAKQIPVVETVVPGEAQNLVNGGGTTDPASTGLVVSAIIKNLNDQKNQKIMALNSGGQAGNAPILPKMQFSLNTGNVQNGGYAAQMAQEIQKLVEQAQQVKQAGGQIRVRLESTPLGKMDVQFKPQQKHLTIVVESEQARNEFLRLLPQIQQNLLQKGVELTGVQVNVNGFSYANSDAGEMNGRKKYQSENNNGFIQGRKEVDTHVSSSTVISRRFGYNTLEVTA